MVESVAAQFAGQDNGCNEQHGSTVSNELMNKIMKSINHKYQAAIVSGTVNVSTVSLISDFQTIHNDVLPNENGNTI